MKKKKSLLVLGGGEFGTTLAQIAKISGWRVHLWVRNPKQARDINKRHENRTYLPGVKLHSQIRATTSLRKIVHEATMIIFAVPSRSLTEVCRELRNAIKTPPLLVSAIKGVEEKTLQRPSQILKESFPKAQVAVLSGPSFAAELIQRKPTALSIAAQDLKTAQFIQQTLSTPFFRLYSSTDVIGVEVGGALKNIIAIAAGISDGLGLGENARASLITRGLAEMIRFGVFYDALPQTFAGLSGLGDLILTTTSNKSRNRKLGLKIGKGKNTTTAVQSMKTTVEGVGTAKAVFKLAKQVRISLPIMEQVYAILYQGKSPKTALKTLLARPLKEEIESFQSL